MVYDIVFVLDVSGSMEPCLDALKVSIGAFIDSLQLPATNIGCRVKDWRAKVVAYRDFNLNGFEPFIDNPFVRDANLLKAQLTSLRAEGNKDEPRPMLDVLFRMATMGQTEIGKAEDSFKWRHRTGAIRTIFLVADSSFHPTLTYPEARGATVEDVICAIITNRIRLTIFAPDMPCYEALSCADRSEYFPFPSMPPKNTEPPTPYSPRSTAASKNSSSNRFIPAVFPSKRLNSNRLTIHCALPPILVSGYPRSHA